MTQNTIDHIAELISQQTTDRLLALALLLFFILIIIALLTVWRLLPVLREGSRARFEMAKAFDSNTTAMNAVKEELSVLRKEIRSSRSFVGWLTGGR